MKEEYINPFLVPARLVWKKELGVDLELANATKVSHQFTTDDITAVIGVSGSLEGNVLYGFHQDTAKSVVSKMMESVVTEFDEMALSALGEIANMITGNAATGLSNAGYPCQISPPVLIEPAGSTFTTMAGPQILVAFTSELGPLHIRISLTEKSVGA